jgi:hypothetical protein
MEMAIIFLKSQPNCLSIIYADSRPNRQHYKLREITNLQKPRNRDWCLWSLFLRLEATTAAGIPSGIPTKNIQAP